MAGGTFSFAEILRDEYAYLHGASPRFRPEIEAKHLRELPHLIRRLKGPATAKESLIARFCDFASAGGDATKECEVVTHAFRKLLTNERVVTDGRNESLYAALLHYADDPEVQRLRDPDVLRKLLRIPHARRLVFDDEPATQVVAEHTDLRDAVAANCAAVRILAADAGGREILTDYPALLSTIADDQRLENLLVNDAGLRKALLEKFRVARPWYARLPFGRLKPKPRMDLRELARDARKLEAALLSADTSQPAAGKDVPTTELTLFNAIVLETAFPEYFIDSYDVRSLNTALHEQDMAALCLSGGGIRSATFNLGVVQGLADHGLLTRFHYLSTVSGGGYIGSWLSSWVRRHNDGPSGVAKDLSAPSADPEEPELRPIQHLREYSSYLAPRSASLSADTWTLIATYLRNLMLNWTMLLPALAAVLAVPRLVESVAYTAAGRHWPSAGVTAFALVSVAIVGIAVLRPRNDKKTGRPLKEEEIRKERPRHTLWLYPLGLAAITFCIYWGSLTAPPHPLLFASVVAVASATASVMYVCTHLYSLAPGGSFLQRLVRAGRLLLDWKNLRQTAGEIAAAGSAGFAAGALLHFLFSRAFPPALLTRSDVTLFFEQYICFGIPLFLATAFAEATLFVGLTTLRTDDHDREWWARSAALMLLIALVWMVAALVALVLPFGLAQLPVILPAVGGVSGVVSWLLARSAKLRSKEERETKTAKAMRGFLQLGATVAVAVILAAVSLAVTAILAQLNAVLDTGTPAIFSGWYLTDTARLHLQVLHQSGAWTITAFIVGAATLAIVMSLLLDVNIYSMHGMYRNRLIRAYLGASRWFRRPDAFTGFDPQDNVDMFELRAEALWTSSYVDFDEFVGKLTEKPHLFDQLSENMRAQVSAYRGALQKPPKDQLRSELTRELNVLMARRDLTHNVLAPPSVTLFTENRAYLDQQFGALLVPVPCDASPRDPIAGEKPTALVVLGDDDPEKRIYDALRERAEKESPQRRRPPLHIVNTALNLVRGDNLAWQERKADSFTISPLHAGNRRIGYRDSFEYGDHISLGTALAVSGAAISPNMGQNSSPALTFLMTLFNARLGWWLGNPSKETFRKTGPTSTLQSLLSELTGNTNDSSDYVFLSDGGHFDNLGLYEMVRRRCRYIIVSDATADGKYAFGDLGNAVRKIRIDMGIPIRLVTTYLPPGANEKDGRYCALGLIEYGAVDSVPEDRRFGHLLYIKPAVYGDCPPDIRNYQKESASFPHQTTVDQFFCESQFESYRALGRHIVGRMCEDRLGVEARQPRGVAELIIWGHKYVQQVAPSPVQVRLV